MVTEDQREIVNWLASPAAYGGEVHSGETVTRVDTHTAIVFLAGPRARKLKRAVRYDYLDFSTADRRRVQCEAEVRLNRRTAPGIYRGVTAVVRRPDGSLAIGGAGQPLDWLVEMNRFDQEQLFDRLAERQQLSLDLMRPLAAAVAALHAVAAARPDHGGAEGMRWVVNGNAAGFAEFGRGALDSSACDALTAGALDQIGRHAVLLEMRRAGGLVRQCHGDLHLGNIVLLDDRPTLFDAIEFNDEIACTDVLYDLAFLLMDLWRRQLRDHANVAWNQYLADTGDHSGLALLPLFLSCRAAVRAKTSATAATLAGDTAARRGLERTAGEYLAMAGSFLHPAPPALVAIGGFSGTGKSTLARGLAPRIGAAPGAVIVRSDEIRKRMCGLTPLQHLGPEGYTADMSQRVYGALAAEAAAILASGSSVIVDAVFANPDDRAALTQVAADARAPLVGLWLEAPERVLVERLERRVADASDADARVLRGQQARGAGTIHWTRLDSSSRPEAVLRRAQWLAAASTAAA
jgi:aminoglycoside phosphotransferase family enzyme/predicted kinase